ncbi:hypothetical protein [Nitrospira sp. Kam-Ns4a]
MNRLAPVLALALLLPAVGSAQTGGVQAGVRSGAGSTQAYPGGFRAQRDNGGNSGILYRAPGCGFHDYQYFPPVSARAPIVPSPPLPGPAAPAAPPAVPTPSAPAIETIITQTPGLLPQLQLER